MGNQRLDRVEKRISEASGNAINMTFDNPAERISFLRCSVQQVRPSVLVRLTSDLHQISMERKSALFLGNDSSGHKWQRQPAGEMTSTPRIIEPVPFDTGGPVRVTRTRNIQKFLIIRRFSVRIPEYDGNRGSGCVTLKDSA